MKRVGYLFAIGAFALIALHPVRSAAAERRPSNVSAEAAATVLSSGWLQAEEGTTTSHEGMFKLINFLIVAGVLGFLLRKPLANFFSDRLDAIQQALSQGRQAAEASEAKLAEVERKLANVQQEIAAFRAESEREMQAERERLKQAAELEAQRILEFAQVQIEAATRLAKAELRKQAAKQAVELAEVLVQQRLDDTARQRLVGNFVAGLKGKSEIKN